jgi:hypothetical protein
VAGAGILRLVAAGRLFDVSFMPDAAELALPVVRGASVGVTTNAIGTDHECILKRSGTVWCRGAGFFDFYTAVTELGTDLVEVQVGYGFTCVRSEIGEVRCMGASERGQLGSLPLPQTGRSVIAIPIATGAVELSLGLAHACARMQDGSVRCWGAFGDAAFGARPTTVSEPAATGCAPSAQRFWGQFTQPSRPVDEFSDSALAWTQEQCRKSGGPVEACVRDEATLLNGCPQSLVDPASSFSACMAEVYWTAALCAASSTGDSAACAPSSDACDSQPNDVAFCARRTLRCENNGAVMTVSADQVCDGTSDCPSGFDEANCATEAQSFTCADGGVTALSSVYDGVQQCPDGSDEWL